MVTTTNVQAIIENYCPVQFSYWPILFLEEISDWWKIHGRPVSSSNIVATLDDDTGRPSILYQIRKFPLKKVDQ